VKARESDNELIYINPGNAIKTVVCVLFYDNSFISASVMAFKADCYT